MIRSLVLAACLSLAFTAHAQVIPPIPPAVTDAVYKGVVGKALDVVPMDAEKRVVLQRTNAVVSNTITGRSLSVWAGLSNPVLLIAGVVWGIYSAINIKVPVINAEPNTIRHDPVDGAAIQMALLVSPPAEEDADVVQ
jgi:hypothetical protein